MSKDDNNGRHRKSNPTIHSRTSKTTYPTYQGAITYSEDHSYYPLKSSREGLNVEVGEVIGWRAWRLKGGKLHSMIADYEWPTDEPATAPYVAEYLGIGIHAFKNKKQAIGNYWFSSNMVIGQVALWGEIYEFEKGWHSEYARIHSLSSFAFCPLPYRMFPFYDIYRYLAIRRLKKLYNV